MSKQIDYKRIVNVLNKELEDKYASKDMIIPFPEFEYKNNHHYFSYSEGEYRNFLITFLKCHVYISEIYAPNENSETKIVEISKEWFNKYIDTLIKLKF